MAKLNVSEKLASLRDAVKQGEPDKVAQLLETISDFSLRKFEKEIIGVDPANRAKGSGDSLLLSAAEAPKNSATVMSLLFKKNAEIGAASNEFLFDLTAYTIRLGGNSTRGADLADSLITQALKTKDFSAIEVYLNHVTPYAADSGSNLFLEKVLKETNEPFKRKVFELAAKGPYGVDSDHLDSDKNTLKVASYPSYFAKNGPFLFKAVLEENLDNLRILIDTGWDVNILSADHYTPLTALCKVGSRENFKAMLGLLLEAGADINHRVDGGEALAHRCASINYHNLPAVLAAGANRKLNSKVGAKDALSDDRLIELAINEGDAKFIGDRVVFSDGRPILSEICNSVQMRPYAFNRNPQMLSVIRNCVKAGQDINQTPEPELANTLLHVATRDPEFNHELVKGLLDLGANPELKNHLGKTFYDQSDEARAFFMDYSFHRARQQVEAETGKTEAALPKIPKVRW